MIKNKACQTYDFIEVKTISQAWLPLFTGYMHKIKTYKIICFYSYIISNFMFCCFNIISYIMHWLYIICSVVVIPLLCPAGHCPGLYWASWPAPQPSSSPVQVLATAGLNTSKNIQCCISYIIQCWGYHYHNTQCLSCAWLLLYYDLQCWLSKIILYSARGIKYHNIQCCGYHIS